MPHNAVRVFTPRNEYADGLLEASYDRPMTEAGGGDDLVRRAQAVLERNRRGDHTCPSAKLYPHQWLWDSCFTAIGITRYDPARAAGELRALFRGQWANGMLPHMIFAPASHDIGSRTVWRSHRFPDAPRDVATTCITQPPIAAIAVERVAAALSTADRDAFVAELLPKLISYHEWLFRERTLDGSALITLIHPWECGLDSTPPWMRALRDWRMPAWLRAAERLHLSRLLRSLRYDTRHLPATERASDDDGLRMIALAVHAKRFDFVMRQLPRDNSVLIEDVGFNAMFAAANQALSRLGDTTLTGAIARHHDAIDDLWHEDTAQYCSRNAVTHALIAEPTVAGFLPAFAGFLPSALVQRLHSHANWPAYPVPSVPIDARDFQETRYWKGPTWVNTNWMIIDGLERNAHADLANADLANELRRRTLALVDEHGFSEYFSPLTGDGHGADEFSWTAALTIDLALTSEGKGATVPAR